MILELKDIAKSYVTTNENLSVLKHVNLKLELGDIVAILGQSGSGKSTLLSILGGLDQADHGDLLFLENKFSQLDENALTELRSKNIGIVFQHFYLVPYLSAVENVMLPLEILGEQNIYERAVHALTSVGLKHRLTHMPHELSGGEAQRVAIARAMIHRPKLILADEPSGNLDTKTGEEVMNLLFNLVEQEKMTMILVTHNIDLAKKCKKVFNLENGILSEITL